jgi:NitT/TauT family transport system permease protein
MKAETFRWGGAHLVFIAIVLALGEWLTVNRWLDPTFVGQPSGVIKFLWNNIATGKLWTDMGWTMAGTLISFTMGSVAAMAVGLMFVAFPQVEKFLDPYLNAMNVMPRIALAPLFILWFGLGLGY